MIKAFMFDLDGTLIDENYYMSPKTIEALKHLKEKGYVMVINSGRPVFLSNYVTDPTLGKKFFDYAYGNNGSEFYDNLRNESQLLKFLNPEEIHEIAKIYDDDLFVYGVYEPGEVNRILMNRITTEPELLEWLYARGLTIEEADFQKIEKNYAKIVCIHKKDDYDISMKYINEHQNSFFKAVPSSAYCIELIPDGISKASSVEHFIRLTGIKADEIIAFGDSGNDIPMLESVCGVIMGNANEENRKKIKEKTLSVREDGVYVYLKKNGYLD